MIYENGLELIGNTPIIKINKLTEKNNATVLAKLESYNLGGSVKDRMALYMIEDAERSGKLTMNKNLIEASSGNTGIAMAMIAAIKGYKITIVIPEGVSFERRKLIKFYGAELILSKGLKGTGGAVELKNEMLFKNPRKYTDLNQFENPANIEAHYQTTGKEIWEQTQGKVDIIVMGLGTGGTGVGVSKRIKEYNSKVKVIGVLPELGTPIQGLRNPKEINPTKLLDEKYFDEIIEIEKERFEDTLEVSRNLAKKEGLLVGMSSGAAMYVALEKAKQIGKEKTIVVILPDTGERYLSTKLFED
ncbi:PLP-dependent cysteine synthase family protein [Patescibacteria group bacterium]|nr:PLP-dependent cysteine synthase family protein [Patescibacteria group bacterium]